MKILHIMKMLNFYHGFILQLNQSAELLPS